MSTYEQIIRDLENKIYRPVYLLMGEEPYYIDKISDYIASKVLTAEEKEFNQTVLYGKDSEVRNVDSLAKRYPMMASYQVVIVKEAQDLKGIEDLHHYVQKPLASTILVICHKYKSIDKKKKLYKAAEKTGAVFESKKLYENQVPDWISSQLRNKGFTILPDACAMLNDFLGNDLAKISNELEKLAIILKPGSRITPQEIEKNIGVSKDYNVFELQKALGQKDVLKSNKIVNYFAQNPKDNNITVVISSLFGYFSKLLCMYFVQDKSKQNLASVLQVHPFFVQDYLAAQKKYPSRKLVEIVGILREYDMKAKGVGSASPPESLLKEMVYRILH
jgi:DNA polymerase III subunit delta